MLVSARTIWIFFDPVHSNHCSGARLVATHTLAECVSFAYVPLTNDGRLKQHANDCYGPTEMTRIELARNISYVKRFYVSQHVHERINCKFEFRLIEWNDNNGG